MKFKESYKYINPEDYIEQFAVTDWYLQLQPELQEYFYRYDGNRENKSHEWLEKRNEFVKMVCELLEAGKIALGGSGRNWDKDRLPIDTIVIHHTSTPSDTPVIAIDALVYCNQNSLTI